jgi:predicted MPP superfamily phosphohydrolase
MGFTVRQIDLAILPPSSAPVRVLHFSDLHLTRYRKDELKFISSWIDLQPDLIISTGDHIASAQSIPLLLDALNPLLGIPGLYVFGSNDYFAPKFKNPIRYLLEDKGERIHGRELPWDLLDHGLSSQGWINLNTRKIEMAIKGISFEFRGTDDAHLEKDDYQLVAGKRSSVDISVGVTHAPYSRILNAMEDDGVDLIFAGHTHGGQIRVPWFGGSRSLTTNCDLPNWRSRGLTQGETKTWLHVSAGLGSNPFTPFRLFSPKEVSLITLKALDPHQPSTQRVLSSEF